MKELNPVPERIRCQTGCSPEISNLIDNFFLEIKNYLDDKYGKTPHTEIIVNELAKDGYYPNPLITDQRLTWLKYNDYCVAGVLELRTAFNDLEYIFFRDLSNLNSRMKKHFSNHSNP